MDDLYENIEKYNPNKKSKIFIAFDDIIADMLSNNKLSAIVTELFIRGIKTICFYYTILFSCSKKY